MELLFASFVAGLVTVLAPCVIAVLPVILTGSLGEKSKWRPLIITASLGVSVILFTLLLKATTLLIEIPPKFWEYFSGLLITAFGFTMVFPGLWEKLAFKLKLYKSEELIQKGQAAGGTKGAIILGASLGPIFASCSPTYLLIVSIVLPQNFANGLLNLTVYTIGMLIPLMLLAYGGQRIAGHFRGFSNPNGWFKRTLGIILVIVGVAIFTGYVKEIETKLIEKGYLGPVQFEQSLTEDLEL